MNGFKESPSQPKSQHKLQAQVEMFSRNRVDDFSDDQGKLLQYSVELSKIKDFRHPPLDTPTELIELLKKYPDSYIEFLRKEQRLETDCIEKNIQIYNQQYRAVIAELKKKLETVGGSGGTQLPEYLGSGSNGDVFRIEIRGEAFAVKFSRSMKLSPGATQINFQIKALLRAKGLPHTAQLVAYSFEDGVLITELLPGKDVTKFDPQHAPEYSDEHISQLIDTVIELNHRGVVIDPRPSNFMYAPQEGFSVLDFCIQQGDSDPTLRQQIMSVQGALCARTLERITEGDPDYAEKIKAQADQRDTISTVLMERLSAILKTKNVPLNTPVETLGGISRDRTEFTQRITALFHQAEEPLSEAFATQYPEEYNKFKQSIRVMPEETTRKIVEAGFDIVNHPQRVFALHHQGLAGSIRTAQEHGYQLSPEQCLGQGGSKIAFLLEDGTVLKLESMNSYLGDYLKGHDEVSFYTEVQSELGDATSKLLAEVHAAGKGIPGSVQEPVLQTEQALRLSQAAGNTSLVEIIRTAHESNPLVRHGVFEKKTTNTGLVLRNDGQIYIVGMDTSGGADIDHIPGRWETLRQESNTIISITPEAIFLVPQLQQWLKFSQKK